MRRTLLNIDKRTACAAMLFVLSLGYLHDGAEVSRLVAASPVMSGPMVGRDASHYLRIADAFSLGDFSMRHLRPTKGADLAHRQPLYPALLAAQRALFGSDPAVLALLNIALVLAAAWVLYGFAAAVLQAPLAGLTGAAWLLMNPFVFRNATEHLLTEPTYLVTALAAVLAFATHQRRGGGASLALCALCAALAYDARVNGLALAIALCIAPAIALAMVRGKALLLSAAWSTTTSKKQPERQPRTPPEAARRTPPRQRHQRHQRRQSSQRRATSYAQFLVAALIFFAATAPSWLPRAYHTGNPVYHGYLPNYLWVDDYNEAHVPGPPRFGPADYARTHDVSDAASRVRHGLRHVFSTVPREAFGERVYFLALAAAALGLAFRDRAAVLVTIAGLAQLLPLVWTALPNPNYRVVAGTLLPLLAALIVLGFAPLELAAAKILYRRKTCGTEPAKLRADHERRN